MEWQYQVDDGKWLAYDGGSCDALEEGWLGGREVVKLCGHRLVHVRGEGGAWEEGGEGGCHHRPVRRLAK